MVLCMIGTTELIVIGGAILLLFGGKKIPGLMKSMGQGVKSFKQGLHEDIPEEKPEEKDGKKEKSEQADDKYALSSDTHQAKNTETEAKENER